MSGFEIGITIFNVAAAVVNVGAIWFWLRGKDDELMILSMRRKEAETAKEAADEARSRLVSDAELPGERLPPGAFTLFDKPFVGAEFMEVTEWSRVKDFPCRKLGEGDNRRIVGFAVGTCEEEIKSYRCPRLQKRRGLYICGAHAVGREDCAPIRKEESRPAHGGGRTADVGHFDGPDELPVAVDPRPVADGEARAGGEAVAPEVDNAEDKAAKRRPRDKKIDEGLGFHAAESSTDGDGRKAPAGNA